MAYDLAERLLSYADAKEQQSEGRRGEINRLNVELRALKDIIIGDRVIVAGPAKDEEKEAGP